jgi:hypothetical protein
MHTMNNFEKILKLDSYEKRANEIMKNNQVLDQKDMDD